MLNSIENRNARWYYLSALANASIGQWNIAQDHIRSAYAKEPDNMTYHQAYTDITNGITHSKRPVFKLFDFGDTAGSQTYTYNYNPSKGKAVAERIK